MIVYWIQLYYYHTSTGGGVDYSDVTQTLSFTNSMTRLCVNIPITNDSVYENTESFNVRLNTTDQDVNIVPDQAVVNIDDNDGEISLTHSHRHTHTHTHMHLFDHLTDIPSLISLTLCLSICLSQPSLLAGLLPNSGWMRMLQLWWERKTLQSVSVFSLLTTDKLPSLW